MQNPIAGLLELGRLPSVDAADPGAIEKFQSLLSEIARPITTSDAVKLAGLLGPDDCYGLAWTVVHMLEEAPGWPLDDAIAAAGEEWSAIFVGGNLNLTHFRV